MLPTVADLLDLPVLAAGEPQVLVGGDAMDRQVRWVHVSELSDVAGTLSGGELILSTGMALTGAAAALEGYVASLAGAGAVGLVVELGQHVQAAPPALVSAARRQRLPLVVLRRTVRFVEVTEVVHARIINAQYEEMQFSERVHTSFAALSVEGAAADDVLARASALSGHPVVLEDLAHHALAFGGPVPAQQLLHDWESRSRLVPLAAGTTSAGPEGWTCTPVGPREARWGRLVVPRRTTGQPGVPLVLERAAETLTISRLLQRDALSVELEAQDAVLQDLLRRGATDEAALRSRLRALGLRTGGAYAVLVAQLAGPGAGNDPAPSDREVLACVVDATRRLRLSAVAGVLHPGQVGAVLSCRSEQDERAVVQRLHEALAGTPHGRDLTYGASAPVPALSALPGAVEEAAHVARVAATLPLRRTPGVHRSVDLGVRGLLWWLRHDPRLQSFTEAQLGPLLTHHATHRDDLLDALRHYVTADGSVTAFARAVHLSRPAAYARLDRLRSVLGVDLSDPEARLSVHVALLAHDQSERPGASGRREGLRSEVPPAAPRPGDGPPAQ